MSWSRRGGRDSVLMIMRRLVSLQRERGREQRAELAAFRSSLRAELERSRRYDRSFILMRAPLPASNAAHRHTVIDGLRAMLRGSDLLCVADRHLYLLVPEAERAAGELLVARIRESLGEGVTSTELMMVAFPQDGLTLGALLASLRGGTAEQQRRLGHIPRRRGRKDPSTADGGRKAG